MLYIDGLFIISSFSTWTQWMAVIKWLSCLWWNLMHAILWYLFVYLTPFPNDYVCHFNHLYDFQVLILYLALLNLYLRDPYLERKASFFLKWYLLLPLGFTFCNLGTFWVLTGTICSLRLHDLLLVNLLNLGTNFTNDHPHKFLHLVQTWAMTIKILRHGMQWRGKV